jgi:metal-responsive CopG/Arc/MetJ family transcriptional regulator
MKQTSRTYRLQVDMRTDEYRAIDDFWFRERLPTRSAAVRELLRRGLLRAKVQTSHSQNQTRPLRSETGQRLAAHRNR